MGRQIAYALAEAGFDVVINYNKSRRGALEAVKHIQGLGRSAMAIQADISSRKDVERLFSIAIKRFKFITLLINNSSIFLKSPLLKTSDSIWDRTLNINLKGTFLCSQAAARHMLKNRKGKIINIASIGGLKAWQNHIPYSVSKAGVIMLTRCLAKALAPHVTVNAVAPGVIVIPGEESSRLEHVPMSRIPLKRYGKPGDITSLVVHLATTAHYITGQVFAVDGGRCA